jgi:SCP-2 sterol transfer family
MRSRSFRPYAVAAGALAVTMIVTGLGSASVGSGGTGARYELKLRGRRSWFMDFDDGEFSISEQADGPVDCHISAEPVTFLLTAFGRIGPLRPAVTGRLFVWRNKPHLALKFRRLLKAP